MTGSTHPLSINQNPQEDINGIEEIYPVQDATVEEAEDCSTEVKVELLNHRSGMHRYVLGLVDTGARSNFIKRDVLKGIPHTVNKVNIQSQGRYGSATTIRERATFQIKLPQFSTA